MNVDISKYNMTEKELESFGKFKKDGNKHLEENGSEIITTLWSEPFSGMLQSFSFITEKLDFSKPFRVIIDYDPEQKQLYTTMHLNLKQILIHRSYDSSVWKWKFANILIFIKHTFIKSGFNVYELTTYICPVIQTLN